MHTFFLAMGLGLCCLILLSLYRVIWGPTIIDRIMGGNIIGTKTAVLLVLIGLLYGRVEMFVDIALAYALLNFIVTLCAARYFQHRRNLIATGYGFRHRGEE